MKSTIAILLMAAACRNAAKTDPGVPAVNDLVPANYKYKLDFVMRTVNAGIGDQQLWKVPAPKSWRFSGSGGDIVPQGVVSGKSYMQVSMKACKGQCNPQTPESTTDAVRTRELSIQINGRPFRQRVELITEHAAVPDDGVYINVYTWEPTGSGYNECNARIAPEIRDAQQAFETACMLAMPI
jgi:hypothetical protein